MCQFRVQLWDKRGREMSYNHSCQLIVTRIMFKLYFIALDFSCKSFQTTFFLHHSPQRYILTILSLYYYAEGAVVYLLIHYTFLVIVLRATSAFCCFLWALSVALCFFVPVFKVYSGFFNWLMRIKELQGSGCRSKSCDHQLNRP